MKGCTDLGESPQSTLLDTEQSVNTSCQNHNERCTDISAVSRCLKGAQKMSPLKTPEILDNKETLGRYSAFQNGAKVCTESYAREKPS